MGRRISYSHMVIPNVRDAAAAFAGEPDTKALAGGVSEGLPSVAG